MNARRREIRIEKRSTTGAVPVSGKQRALSKSKTEDGPSAASQATNVSISGSVREIEQIQAAAHAAPLLDGSGPPD